LFVVLLLGVAAQAQSINLPEPRNAALLYWQAFAMMKDQSLFDSLQMNVLASKVLKGEKTWDEAGLEPVVDRNEFAIETMQHATLLPECDWGVDYSAGYATPLQHLTKGRILGDLNLLYGIRALAKHDNPAAARAFVAGIRFARHLGQDGTVLGLLIASGFGLHREYWVLEKVIAYGQLDSESKAEIAEALRALPKYGGFDWAGAVRLDGFVVEGEIEQLRTSSNPTAIYESWFHELPSESRSLISLLPSDSDMKEFRSYINDIATAYELPPDTAQPRLDDLEAKSKSPSLNPIVQMLLPNLLRLNHHRKQLEEAREALLQQLDKP
jgi:hypothetical protein